MIDNSDIQQKLHTRRRGMELFHCPESPKIVDLYAGTGVISELMWKHYTDDLTLIEKEANKAAQIKFGKVIIGNNKDYLNLTIEADIVDADAYGLVFKTISDIVKISKKRKIIFFTESNPFTKSIYKSIDTIRELNPLAYWIEKSNSSSVFYGYLII